MFDTVALRHEIPLPQPFELDSYRADGWKVTEYNGYLNLSFTHKQLPRLRWSQCYGKGWLTVETSLATWLYDDNVNLLPEAELSEALTSLSEFVSGASQRNVNCHVGLVGRVDFASDFHVGEKNITSYVSAALAVSIPRFDRPVQQGIASILFKNKVRRNAKEKKNSRELAIYGKYRKVIDDAIPLHRQREALGKLRIEPRFMGEGVRALATRYGVSRHARDLLREDIASKEIRKAIAMLQLDKPKAADFDARMDALIEAYGLKKAEELIGFLNYLDRFEDDFYKLPELDYSERTYRRRASLCRAAGVWKRPELTATIPALRINGHKETNNSNPSRVVNAANSVSTALRLVK